MKINLSIPKEDFKNKLGIRDGKDGAPGKDGVSVKGTDGANGKEAPPVDETALLTRLENNLPQLGTRIRDSLELLVDGERLDISSIKGIDELETEIKKAIKDGGGRIGWGAHPLTIQQSGTTKAKVARVINFTGATVTLSPSGVITVAVSAATGDVAGPSSSVDSEVAVFSGTGGKTIKRAAGTGYAKLTSGVLSAQATPIPVADGGTGVATFTSGDILIGNGTGAVTVDNNLTWSATTGLLIKKGISSQSAIGGGTEIFGLGAVDNNNGAGASPQNTLVGANTVVSNFYSTNCVALGYGATTGHLSTALGANAIASGGSDVAIGQGVTSSSQFAVVIGSGSSASNSASLAIGFGNAAAHADAVCFGWGGHSTRAGELSYRIRSAANETPSFRLGGSIAQYSDYDMFDIATSFTDVTASNKQRVGFSVYDSVAAREFLRADANGAGVNVYIPTGLKVGGLTTAATAVLQLVAGTATASTAPLKFTLPGVPLTVAASGVMETDAERLYYTPTSTAREALVGCIFTQTANKTVTNTVSETSIIGTGVGYGLTLPANFFVAGKTIRLRIGGIYSTPIGAPSVTIKIKYGSTVIASVATTSLLSGASALEFDGEVDITCYTTGATGTVYSHGDIEYATGVGGTIAVNPLNNGGASTTIDTTTSNLLDCTIVWDSASTTRIVTSTITVVEVLN